MLGQSSPRLRGWLVHSIHSSILQAINKTMTEVATCTGSNRIECHTQQPISPPFGWRSSPNWNLSLCNINSIDNVIFPMWKLYRYRSRYRQGCTQSCSPFPWNIHVITVNNSQAGCVPPYICQAAYKPPSIMQYSVVQRTPVLYTPSEITKYPKQKSYLRLCTNGHKSCSKCTVFSLKNTLLTMIRSYIMYIM